MADQAGSPTTTPSPFRGNILKPNIPLASMVDFVAVAERTLRNENLLPDPAQSYAKIDKSILTDQFLNARDIPSAAPAYLNGNAKKLDDITPGPAQLSLEDLHIIFHEIAQRRTEGILRREYNGDEVIDSAEKDLLKDIENGNLPLDRKLLHEKTELLLSILTKMEKKDQVEGDVVQADATPDLDFPQEPYLKLIEKNNFSLATSWEWIRPLIKDLHNGAKENAVAVVYYKRDAGDSEDSPAGEEHRIAVIPVRNYLNAWLELVEETLERYKSRGIDTGISLPLPKYASSKQSVGYSDLEMWTGIGDVSDMSVTAWLAGNLIKKLNDLLKLKLDEIKAPHEAPVDATEGGGEPTELREEKKEDFRAAFLDAGTTYSQEAARLAELLFPQMVEQQLGVAQAQLAEFGIDNTGYALAQREFRLELENLLRSLSPADLQMLQDGNRTGFRLTLLRRLHAKLGTNPRFIGAIEQYRDDCVDALETTSNSKESPLLRKQAKILLTKIDRRKTADPATFEEEFVDAANNSATWDEETAQKLAKLIELRQHLSQATLTTFLKELEKPPSDTQIAALFANLDLIVAERWSPEHIRTLSPAQFNAILGIDLSSLPPEERLLILSLCSELLYSRRRELAKKYELDALGRTAEADSKADDQPLTPEQIEVLEKKKKLSEMGVDGELLSLVKGATPEKLQQLTNEKKLTPEQLSAAYALRKDLIEGRKSELESERLSLLASLSELSSFEEKQRFLETQGYYAQHLEDESALADYVDQVQQAEYQSALHTLENGSLLDEEEGYVADDDAGGARQDFGTYDKVKSLGSRRAVGKKHERRRFGRGKKKDLAKTAENVEKIAGTALLGPPGRNKTVRRTAAGLVVTALQFFANASIGAKLLAGLVGGVTTFALGPVAGIAAGAGTLLGVGALENAAHNFFSGGSSGGPSVAYNLPTPAIPGITTPLAPAAAPTLAAKGAAEIGGPGMFGTSLTATQVMATVGTTTYFIAATATNSALIASFLPPALSTLGADGTDSPYVVIAKVATDTAGRRINNLTFPTPQTTHQVKYTITVDAKELPNSGGASYQIALTGLTDEMMVYENAEEREGRPALTAPSCSEQISFEKLTAIAGETPTFGRERLNPLQGVATDSASSSLGPLEIADGRIRLGECTLTYDESFNHTTVMNKITITFNTVDENGAAISTTASSAHTLCFGKCPKLTGGGWPTTGTLTQGPYASGDIRTRNGNVFPATHSRVDAIDIGAGGQSPTPPICAPFGGTAYFFNGASASAGEKGLGWEYGNHAVVVVNSGPSNSGSGTPSGFVLVFAHFNNFDLFAKAKNGGGGRVTLGKAYPISRTQPLGQMGTTGNSTGNHLHYEYRVWSGSSWQSYSSAATKTRILETLIGNNFRYEENDGQRVGPSVCPPGTPSR